MEINDKLRKKILIILSIVQLILLVVAARILIRAYVLDEKEYCVHYTIHDVRNKECFKNKTIFLEFIDNLSKKKEQSDLLNDSILFTDSS